MERFSRRQFITGGAVAALGGTLALAGCAPSGSSNAKGSNGAGSGSSAGIGSGMGKHGQFDVEVMVTDGNLDRITVLNSRETPGMGDVAMEELTQLIVDNQTLNVDTVSGATLSSMAFIGAVSDALDQAGQKSSDWRKRDKATPAQTELPASADVVVVGGGGAGFAAAITAANAGKSVVLLEKMGVFGGDTALSGGEMAAPGNWIQVQEGIADSPDALAKDMLEGGDNAGDPALVQIIAEGALDSSQWLTFEGGISWKHDLMQFGGHNTKRSIIPITHSGSEMTTKLTKRAGEIDTLTLAKNSPAVELVKSGDAITGVKVKNTVTGEESTIACKAVVLASGGFGSNIDMRVKYNPAMDDSILSTDSVGATGDGITMGEAAGANLIDRNRFFVPKSTVSGMCARRGIMPSETMNRREGACTCSASQPLDGNDATELARRNIGAPARCVRSSAARARRFWRRRSSRWEDVAKTTRSAKPRTPQAARARRAARPTSGRSLRSPRSTKRRPAAKTA